VSDSRFRLSLITIESEGREELVFAEAVEDPPWGGSQCTSDTRHPLTFPTGRTTIFRFVVAPISEASLLSICEQAAEGTFTFETIIVTCDQLVARPGVLIPAGSVSEQSLSPDHSFTYRLLEHYSPKERVLYELRASRHYPAISVFICKHAGIDLGTFTDRVGNLLVFRRVSSWRLETSAPLDKQHRWIRAIEGDTLASQTLRLRSRFYEYGELMDETISELPSSGAMFTLPSAATAFEFSLFDPDNGSLLAADAGNFVNEISVSTSLVQDDAFTLKGVTHTVRWIPQDRPGAVADLKTPWRVRTRLRGVRALQEAEARQVRISDGTDRIAIIAMLRGILVKSPTHVEIWDPYFSGDDVIEFLPWISPLSQCRILCGNKAHGISNIASSQNVENIKTQLTLVRGLPRSRNINLRFRVKRDLSNPRAWKAIYHDRFLLSDIGAWVLGTSLNSIGNKPGAIVELQNPEQLLGMFDDEWSRPTEAHECQVSL
jgi:hypothetical protein